MKTQIKKLIILFLFGIAWSPLALFAGTGKGKITVMIDPGHGGNDPGHISTNKSHLPEKDLNLSIAHKFGEYIEKNLSNVMIIYTRTDDSYPTLTNRVDQANAAGVDYFISIHCNANDRHSVHGTESHVHTMSSSKAVSLAKEFEKEFSTKAGRNSRGVKDTDDREHSLQVLKYTKMASVLVECGFMTNDDEAGYLNTLYGQEIIASALFRGFRTFVSTENPTINFNKQAVSAPVPVNKSGTSSTTKSGRHYTIQLMSSMSPMEVTSDAFKGISVPVIRTKLNTSGKYKYKYTAGTFPDQEAAQRELEAIRRKGFPDAYITRQD